MDPIFISRRDASISRFDFYYFFDVGNGYPHWRVGWLANMRPGQLMAPARIGFEKEGWAFTRTVRGAWMRVLGNDILGQTR